MSAPHILVIDDDPGVVGFIDTALTRSGYRVTAAMEYADALDHLNTDVFDAVLCDIYLGVESGVALLDHQGLRGADSAVIVMSGSATREDIITAMRRGAMDFLVKPFEPQELYQRLQSALRRRATRRKDVEHLQNLQKMVDLRTAELSEAIAGLEDAYDLTIEALGAALDLRDSETERHSRNVVALAETIAILYGVTDQHFLRDLRWGALLHDIGKIGIPDAILKKPGPLTPEERQLITTHPDLGYRILSRIGFLKGALQVVRHHHERYDGRGYPDGLAGNEIPLAARIFAVADTAEVLMSGRVYQDALTEEDARREIAACAGTQFDPEVVAAFMEVPLTFEEAVV